MQSFELLVIGGGLASARAIASYREAGGGGAIALVSRDASVPYHRPPLSKRYLRGESDADATLVESPPFYAAQGVDLLLETTVAAVDSDQRVVETEDGRRLGYQRLLIASGTSPRMLGVAGAGLGAIFTLRTLADATAVREAARDAREAVVVGGGFIGMEVAASLRGRGLGVTIVHRKDRLFDALGAPELGEELASTFQDNGVRLMLSDQVAAFRGEARLRSVQTTSGEILSAELAVVGIGVEPVVDFLADSGIELDDGVLVDERFETSVPGIFAVGDVANVYDPLYAGYRRIEHWANANHQGTEVGRLLAGRQDHHDTVSAFFTEVFGVTIKVFGDHRHHDEVSVAGSFAERDVVALYGDRGRLVAALVVGQTGVTETRLKQLLAERAALQEAHALVEAAGRRTVATRER